MRLRTLLLGAAAVVTVALLPQVTYISDQLWPERSYTAGIGNPEAFKTLYRRWAKTRSQADGNTLAIGLGYSKALSAGFTRARGIARIDLVEGAVSVEVSGLEGEGAHDVWLVDNRPGAGRSVAPEAGDGMHRIGTLTPTGAGAELTAKLVPQDLQDFEIDMVAVAPAGEAVEQAGLLFGSPTLFQKLFHHDRDGWYASLATPGAEPAEPAPLSFLVPRPAFAQTAEVDIEALIARGEQLFFEETFGGNGRTCGTCHPANNNLTIDPAFIATLPKDDPLFVAEFNPDLATLERPELMRAFGLILENLDGFDDLENKFTMRGVPHTLALPTSLEPSVIGSQGMPPNERTGWSGDGSPGDGTLRSFATGAVIQHFPRTLNRVAGKDFVLPTERQLLAMEAFQLSLGRQEDIDLAAVEFLDERIERGKLVFLNQTAPEPNPDIGFGQCARCHADAGANINFADMNNANFNTGVELLTDRTARLIDPDVPCDGGFGREKNPDPDPICSRTDTGFFAFGDGQFNTVSLIEAADTGPFFHNNSTETIEDAVLFYNGPEFNDTDIAAAIGGIRLTTVEILEVAAMLRVLNALENIRAAIAGEKEAVQPGTPIREARRLLRLARGENRDAIVVLRDSVLGGVHPEVRRLLRDAASLLTQAIQTADPVLRAQLVEKAVFLQNAAREEMVLVVPGPLS